MAFHLERGEEMNDLTTIIQALGFPTSCVIACAWYINKKDTQVREDANRREERMYAQQDKLAETLDKSTDTIDRMNVRLDVIEDKIDKITQVMK